MARKEDQAETRLSYRIRKLSTAHRERLLQTLNMGRTTLYTKLNQPGTLTLDQASIITRFLEDVDDCEYDITELMRPLEIIPQTAAAE